MSAAQRQAQRARAALPSPPALTGGEENTTAVVDWCTLTWRPDSDEHVAATIHALLTSALGGAMGECVNGMLGYAQGVRFYVPVGGRPVHVGRVDFGGAHHGGRARLDLSGAGCSRVLDWPSLRAVFEGWAESRLTRVDLAVDLLDGEVGVEDARDWYINGDFRAGTSGALPRHSLVGDWLGVPRWGRTLEVGRRENGKMCRVYEKGRQLGDSQSPWVRFEVELRNNDRDLPFDVLTRCDVYFAGAYKCLEQLIEVAGERIPTHQAEGQISLDAMTEFMSVSYGQVIEVHRLRGVSADDILNMISRPGIPRRLERSCLAGFIGAPPASQRLRSV